MIEQATERSRQQAAKVAGIAYLLQFALVVYTNFGIHERLNVRHDAAATARNILAHETLFRVAVVSDLVYCALVVIMLTALYLIVAPSGRGIALVATGFKLMYAASWMVLTLRLFDALRMFRGEDYLAVVDTQRLQALGKFYLTAGFDRYYGGLPFYATWLVLVSYLLLRSRAVPRALAMFGIAANVWCLLCALAFLIDPAFSKVVNPWLFDTAMALFELALSFWFLIKGVAISHADAHHVAIAA